MRIPPTNDSRIEPLNRPAALPLPKGEGRGEGEGSVLKYRGFEPKVSFIERIALVAALALLSVLFLSGCKPQAPGAALLGKPIDIQFKAVDGREVNLANLRGKVVLIDFWATWCPPCVKEVPHIKEAYEKLHSRGFEIIGISFDDKKEDLLSFLNRNKMEWPQFFTAGDNPFARKFGIEEIPTMWLVDKQGKLRDLNGVENLSEKVEKLLAESGS